MGGNLLGGLICKVFKFQVRGLLQLCLGLAVGSWLFCLSFLLNCGPEDVAGISVKYGNRWEEILFESWKNDPFNSSQFKYSSLINFTNQFVNDIKTSHYFTANLRHVKYTVNSKLNKQLFSASRQ